MKGVKDYLKGLSFINKLRVMFSVIILIPILFLGSFIFISSSSFIREQQTQEVENVIERNVLDIDNKVTQCENSLRYLVSNYSLQDFLNTDSSNYMELNTKAKNVGPLLYNTLLSNQYFSKIEVYTEKGFSVLNDLVKKSGSVEEEEWYQKTVDTEQTLWWFDEGNCFATKRITSNYPKYVIGIVKVDIKEVLLKESFDIFQDMPIQISVNSNMGITYMHTNMNTEIHGKIIYTKEKPLQMTGYKILYEVSEKNFMPFFHPRFIISMFIVIFLLIVVWIAIHISSRSLLKHLYVLVAEVREVREGNLEVAIDTSAADEIGDLARSIDKMLKKTQMLIEEVYMNELEKKNLELDLLQSKISPHFLYNNLSAINWIAIENEEDRIYEITTQMATFYRTALNKGVNIDKLRVEIENIKAYIQLQLLAHEHSFDVNYDIDNNLLDTYIPIFIMQPLVENAIEHGIDQLRSERGTLKITVYSKNEMMFIRITDNGKDLFNRIGDQVLDYERYGYGVTNVDKRIKLLCGEKYGVFISADKNGTIAEIHLRIDKFLGQVTS